MGVRYKYAETDEELRQILQLQQQNLPENIDANTRVQQGFVTVKHDLDLLRRMNSAHPHVIAIDGERLVGYTLVMLPDFRDQIPVLVPMFNRLDGLYFRGRKLGDMRYFVMGQVCVDRDYRGTGVFAGLYHQMRSFMQSTFDLNVTQIATRNTRSIRAHEKVGFETIEKYASGGEDWAVVAWNWE